jgi:hypothetical protein
VLEEEEGEEEVPSAAASVWSASGSIPLPSGQPACSAFLMVDRAFETESR